MCIALALGTLGCTDEPAAPSTATTAPTPTAPASPIDIVGAVGMAAQAQLPVRDRQRCRAGVYGTGDLGALRAEHPGLTPAGVPYDAVQAVWVRDCPGVQTLTIWALDERAAAERFFERLVAVVAEPAGAVSSPYETPVGDMLCTALWPTWPQRSDVRPHHCTARIGRFVVAARAGERTAFTTARFAVLATRVVGEMGEPTGP